MNDVNLDDLSIAELLALAEEILSLDELVAMAEELTPYVLAPDKV